MYRDRKRQIYRKRVSFTGRKIENREREREREGEAIM
jgi:hypothetical protein